jgi:hypothetical protein
LPAFPAFVVSAVHPSCLEFLRSCLPAFLP